MLGLFLDHEDQTFQQQLARLREGRVGRAERMVQKLSELGAPVSWQRVREIAGEASVGRPHVAQALVEAGHVATIREAFDRYLAHGGPAFVSREKFSPRASIELIHAVGGLAVIAHPLEGEGSTELVPELAAAGLDGVECYYQSYSREQVETLVELARQHGLVPTGGSDYHGFPMSGAQVVSNEPGSVEIPAELWDELLARRQARAVRSAEGPARPTS
jgi:predicted metal-dependent phosphoesterase TrpH